MPGLRRYIIGVTIMYKLQPGSHPMNQTLSSRHPPAARHGSGPELPARSGAVRSVPPGAALKVLIADDHPFVRCGIKQCINDSTGLSVVGEAGTARDVFDFLSRSQCDVLVLDIGLPDQSGLEVLRILHKTQPALPVLMLTMYPEEQFSAYCLRAGAAGFLNKADASNHLIDAIWAAARGGH